MLKLPPVLASAHKRTGLVRKRAVSEVAIPRDAFPGLRT